VVALALPVALAYNNKEHLSCRNSKRGANTCSGGSGIRPDGSVRLPDEVIREYGFTPGENVILMSSSVATGGFRVTRRALLESSAIYAEMLRQIPDLAAYTLEEGRAVRFKGGCCCWARLGRDGVLALPLHTMEAFDVRPATRCSPSGQLPGRGDGRQRAVDRPGAATPRNPGLGLTPQAPREGDPVESPDAVTSPP
jgi:hypothetical protein